MEQVRRSNTVIYGFLDTKIRKQNLMPENLFVVVIHLMVRNPNNPVVILRFVIVPIDGAVLFELHGP
jgi:hypothetical protein